MMKMKESKWRRELTRARGISSVLYYPYLFVGTTEDCRVVSVLITMMNLVCITLHEWGGRAVFGKKYD
jgi:hypothetical protein